MLRAKYKKLATRSKSANKRKLKPKQSRIQCLDSTKKLNLTRETKVTSLTRNLTTTESLKLKTEINWPKKLANSAASVTPLELKWLNSEVVLPNSKRMAVVSVTEIYLARPKACSTHEEVSLQRGLLSNLPLPIRMESIRVDVKNLTRNAVEEVEEDQEVAHVEKASIHAEEVIHVVEEAAPAVIEDHQEAVEATLAVEEAAHAVAVIEAALEVDHAEALEVVEEDLEEAHAEVDDQ